MHFADWPVWARPKDEQVDKAVKQLADHIDEEIIRLEKVRQEAVKVVARKKPGPKPKAKA